MLKLVKLDPDSIEYVRERISWGKQIGKHLLDLPLNRGEVTAFLPESIAVDRRRNLLAGGIGQTDQLVEPIVDFVSEYLSNNSRKYVIFDDPLAQKNTILQDEQIFVCGSDVYPFVTSTDNYRERLKGELISIGTWYFIGVLTSLDEESDIILTGETITDKKLQMLASRTDHILVNAYDGETLVIWSNKI